MRNKAVIFISGGNYEGYSANVAIEIEPFDWDNFKDDPVPYWETFTSKDVLQQHEPETYQQILAEIKEHMEGNVYHEMRRLSNG